MRMDTTTLMLIRQKQYEDEGKPTDYKHVYIPIERMPNHLIEAAIVAEDPNFLKHSGFDFWGIYHAAKNNLAGGPLRGGSSIDQQTVKNVFLWPDRTWTRKGVETYYTVLVNTVWDKKYIMELYLNSVEMGENIYGIEAAAQEYYGVSASELTTEQCASLLTLLPAPTKWSLQEPTAKFSLRKKELMEQTERCRKEGMFEGANWGIPAK